MFRSCFLFLLLVALCLSKGVAQTEFSLGVEVKDKYTKRSLVPIISVLEINTESELKGKMVDDRYVVQVKLGTQYQVFVALQEYKTHRQTHTFEQNTSAINGIYPFVIELDPVKPPRNIPPPTLVEMSVTTPTKAIEKIEEKPKPALMKELRFVAIDAQTSKPIAAQFKLTDGLKESYMGNTKAEGTNFAPMVLVQKQPYSLTVAASGYRKYESKVTVASELPAEQSPQIIKLSKIEIVLKIRVLDGQTSQPLVANVRVVDQIGKRFVLGVNNAPNGQAAVPLNPDHRYMVEAQAKGFMPYQQALEKAIPVLNETNELIIKLAKIGESNLQLSAIDATTGRHIAATFKITAGLTEQTTEIKSTASPTPVKFKISEPDIYHIETVVVGYTSLQHNVDAEEIAVGQVFNYQAKLTAEVPKEVVVTNRKFNFKVFDAQTQKAIPNLHVKIKNTITQRPLAPKISSGLIQADLQIDQNYLIEVEASGYETASMQMETAAWAKRGEFLTNISLVPLKKNIAVAKPKPVVNEKIFDNIKAGQSVSIEDNVYFDQSSYILRPEAHGQLNRLAAIMLRTPDIKIEIVGHTDNVGDQRLNQILSEHRAKVIANYLRNQGVNEVHIAHRGEGSNKPLAPNDSEENRQRNRRVQFLIK